MISYHVCLIHQSINLFSLLSFSDYDQYPADHTQIVHKKQN